ncbi:hypothetical protein PHLCEN_2v3209 [Hermanssonia centrifuga]|uniref:Uncharacterized protein n=1 Tax=Hermanssonia centrifuga TaxID=98765 RepID=A0A2R6QXQ1_9APHY|nr:hypothetical protein PHLCEN_2v3209 [Hermanssonia centrifuga]
MACIAPPDTSEACPFTVAAVIRPLTLAILPAILALYALAIPLEKRVTVTHIGTINSPVNGTSITPGTPFDFHYTDGWGTSGCYPGYTLINVWLVDHEPAGSELNSTYQLPDGDYLYYFGDFLIINDEGLPPMSPPPPPSTLTLSEPLDPAYDGTELHQIWPHVEQSSIFPLERDLAILKSSYWYELVSAVTEVE